MVETQEEKIRAWFESYADAGADTPCRPLRGIGNDIDPAKQGLPSLASRLNSAEFAAKFFETHIGAGFDSCRRYAKYPRWIIEREDWEQCVRFATYYAGLTYDTTLGGAASTWIYKVVPRRVRFEVQQNYVRGRKRLSNADVNEVLGELVSHYGDDVGILQRMESQEGVDEVLRVIYELDDNRERDVLMSRTLTAKRLIELGRKYKVCRERIRQIEKKAEDRVRNTVIKRYGRVRLVS